MREYLDSSEGAIQILEKAVEGILVLDVKAGKFIYANPAIQRLFGYTKDQFFDLSPVNLHPPDEMDRVKEFFELMGLNPETGRIITLKSRRADGSVFFADIKASIIQIRGLDCAVGFFTDISERIMRDKEQELQRQRLIHSNQNTQKLEALSVLAGGIAHDFNNILGGLFGFIDLARITSGESEVKAFLDQAIKSIGRARALTGQLVTFSKGGAPARKPGNIKPFITDAVRFALSGSNITVSNNIPENLWICDLDTNLMAQAVNNIIINSVQAMPAGGEVSVRAHNAEIRADEHPGMMPGRYVKIMISDNGPGIASEIRQRIFDPFFSTREKASGMGLAVTYSIIQQHGGLVEFEPAENGGSCFVIYLPASVENSFVSSDEEDRLYKGSGHILVMDDDETVRLALVNILKQLGYTPDCAADGEQALVKFLERNGPQAEASQRYTAVLLDLTVPGGKGGASIIGSIREADPDVPVFISSGYSESPVISDPSSAGFTDSLSKPYTISSLSSMLNRYLDAGKTSV